MNLMKRLSEITIIGGFISSIITAGIFGLKNIGEEVYRGEIGGYSVIYEEGRFAVGPDSSFMSNIMTLKKGNTSYFFKDTKYETDIDFTNETKPNFENDKLEIIIIKSGDSQKEYNKEYDYTNPNKITNIEDKIQKEMKEEAFSKSNSLYNSLREKIREELIKELRNKYQQEQKKFTDVFEK